MNKKTTLQTFGLFLTLAGIVAAMPYVWSLTATSNGSSRAGLEVGADAPAIEGLGWINGPGPTAEELKGKVVVVHAFADFCPKCHRGMPALVTLYQAYQHKGVVFVGFTQDGANPETLGPYEPGIQKAQEYAEKYKAKWPLAYGAFETSNAYKVEYIPGYWVIGRNGKVIYNKESKASIEDVLDAALNDGINESVSAD